MQKSGGRSLPSLSVRIDLDAEGRIGPGKIELLENIRAFGSISAAGRPLNLSYKQARDLLDEINHICREAAGQGQTRRTNGGEAGIAPVPTPLLARLPQN